MRMAAFLVSVLALTGCAQKSPPVVLKGKVGAEYARASVPVADTIVESVGTVRLPVEGVPVAFRNLDACEAVEVVLVQALGQSASCSGSGVGVTFVHMTRDAGQLLEQFVRTLRGAGVNVSKVGRSFIVDVPGSSEPVQGVFAGAPVEDLANFAQVAQRSFMEHGFLLRSRVLDVAPDVVEATGLPVAVVGTAAGGSLVLGDDATLETVASLVAPGERVALSVPYVVPDAFNAPLSELGITAASHDGVGTLLVGAPSSFRDIGSLIGDLVADAGSVRADVSFVAVQRSAALVLGPQKLLSLAENGFAEYTLAPVVVTRSGGSSDVSSTVEVPFVSAVVADGTVTETVDFREAGVLVSLSGHVSRDGLINAEIGVSVSSFGPGDRPARFSRGMKSQVRVSDGQSVLLGIIETNEQSAQGRFEGVGPSLSAASGDSVVAAIATLRRVGPSGADLFKTKSERVAVESE